MAAEGEAMHSNDAQMLVLTVLANGPLHGYAINTAIEELAGTRLGPGSLYGALARLEARALIEPAREPSGAQGRNRTMEITATGRDTLRAELEQMARVSRAGLRALGVAPA
ncbi:MAG: PadR family transcriptional regulator [Actinomycetota bacterium]|nr:PadR family transcriptional regulator [Actinomycetota bacterium]